MGFFDDVVNTVVKPISEAWDEGTKKLQQGVAEVLPKGEVTLGIPGASVAINMGQLAQDAIGAASYIMDPSDLIAGAITSTGRYVEDTLNPERLKEAYSSPEAFFKFASEVKEGGHKAFVDDTLLVTSLLPAGKATSLITKPMVKSAKVTMKAAKQEAKIVKKATGKGSTVSSEAAAKVKLAKADLKSTRKKAAAIRIGGFAASRPAKKMMRDYSPETAFSRQKVGYDNTFINEYQEQVLGRSDSYRRKYGQKRS